MYKFESIDDYRYAFEKAYVEGLEKEILSDFDSIALVMMYERIAKETGRIKGVLDVRDIIRNNSPEMDAEVEACVVTIEAMVEASTKRLEELGLL